MINRITRQLVAAIEPQIRDWMQEAKCAGYKIGEEDGQRRMYDLYLRGYAAGAVDAYEKLGKNAGIEEITPEEFRRIMADGNQVNV